MVLYALRWIEGLGRFGSPFDRFLGELSLLLMGLSLQPEGLFLALSPLPELALPLSTTGHACPLWVRWCEYNNFITMI